MKRKEHFKYYVKAKVDIETNKYDLKVKTKGDYFEAIMFAVETITRSLIEFGFNKKDFLKAMGDSYDILKKESEE